MRARKDQPEERAPDAEEPASRRPLIEVVRQHPFAVAQIVLLVVFVAGSALAGFTIRTYAGFASLALASLVAVLILGQGE